MLAAEREHLDLAATCLVAMRADAERIADYGVDALASEGLGRVRAQRLAALATDPDAPPFFGRIDRADGSRQETLHIGRRHVRDRADDPVVVDWRAPISRGFYRATPADPMGVQRRRRFGFRDGRITSFEDEDLRRGQALGLSSELLRQEIERPRVGPMRDIVATIQPDQDDLVRADLDTSLCIQGAPGTGKTAVGLHRAAYLLYTYPDRLRRTGVLVVGPNSAFLHYIAQVLPALGEGGIEQTTVDALVGHVPVTASESAELATLKGDARMAEVLARALRTQVGKPVGDVVPVVGTKRYRIPEHRLRRHVDDARRSGIRWNLTRERLRQQLAEDVRRQREDAGGAPSDAETARVARTAAVREFLDAVWPPLDAPALLARLYREPDLLARCAPMLSAEERAALARPAGGWTAADAVLVDELVGLLDGVPGYVHVVLDEAQDLSPMQCRAVARRCPLGSVTVLGDQAQATTPWAAGSWSATLTHLGHDGAAVQPLTVGYRVPGEVLELANRLLPHIAPELPPARSVRTGAGALSFERDLVAAVQEVAAVEGSVGVIVPDAAVESTVTALEPLGAALLTGDADPRIAVLPASAAKGLEFDSVVLLDPAAVVAGEPTRLTGLRRLYVVLTRAVSRLVVVHEQPLPPELAA